MPRFSLPTRMLRLLFVVSVGGIAGQASGQFTTVYNIPPDPNIGNGVSIGSDTQLNLFGDGPFNPQPDGRIGSGFNAGAMDGSSSNIEVNIFGGTVGSAFNANAGSVINISGGTGGIIGANAGSIVNISGGELYRVNANDGSVANISGGDNIGFIAYSGGQVNFSGGLAAFSRLESGGVLNMSGGTLRSFSTLRGGSAATISGGAIAGTISTSTGANIELVGGEFRLDGTLIDGLDTAGDTVVLDLDIPFESPILSGVLADGTPFALPSIGFRDPITLTAAALPAIGPALITVPNDPAPRSIRAGQRLVVEDGGVVELAFRAGRGSVVDINPGAELGAYFQAINAEINVTGGTVSHFLDVYENSVVNISAGSVGNRFRAGGSVVNLSGGSIGDNALADPISQFNITGGSIGDQFFVRRDAEVNISSGSIGNLFEAQVRSQVNISSAGFGAEFTADENSEIEIAASEFRIDGAPIPGMGLVGDSVILNLHPNSALTGTLVDGTPFAFSRADGDTLSGEITLVQAEALPPDSTVFTLPSGPAPIGIRNGQTLVVETGGVLGDNFNAGRGSVVEIQAGTQVGTNFESTGAEVTILDGAVGDHFDAFAGSVVNIEGGTVGEWFDAFTGSTVNISGGSIGNHFEAYAGSEVNVSGGSMARLITQGGSTINISGDAQVANLSAGFQSTVSISGGIVNGIVASGESATISGGKFLTGLNMFFDTDLKLIGNEFRLNGELIGGLESVGDELAIQTTSDSLLSGTFADGTPFSFDTNVFFSGSVTLVASELPQVDQVISVPNDPAPSSVRAGQILTVGNGGVVGDNFRAGWGSVIEVEEGGRIGNYLEAVGSQINTQGIIGQNFDVLQGTVLNVTGGIVDDLLTVHRGGEVNISGGYVDRNLTANDGSVVNISGGEVGSSFKANSGSEINISGGNIQRFFEATDGSEVNISGGNIERDFRALSGSVVNISGGEIGTNFDALFNSEVNFFATQFFLDGVDISDTLAPNMATTLTERDVTLSGVYEDGTSFSFDLNSGSPNSSFQDFFSADALLTITLIADPIPGDYNNDGTVDLADYTVWRNNLGADITLPGDTSPGTVTMHDYNVWKQNFVQGIENVASNSQTVPEPAGVGLLVVAILLLVGRQRSAVTVQP